MSAPSRRAIGLLTSITSTFFASSLPLHRRVRNDHHHDVAKFDRLRNCSGAGQRTQLVYEALQCIGMAGRKHNAVPGLDEERAESPSLSPGADGADAERGGRRSTALEPAPAKTQPLILRCHSRW